MSESTRETTIETSTCNSYQKKLETEQYDHILFQHTGKT